MEKGWKLDMSTELVFSLGMGMKKCWCELYFSLYVTTNSDVQYKVTDC